MVALKLIRLRTIPNVCCDALVLLGVCLFIYFRGFCSLCWELIVFILVFFKNLVLLRIVISSADGCVLQLRLLQDQQLG